MNETLRRAIFNARLTEADVATRLRVDPKTVRRWLEGRLPYPRHRWDLANLLKADEAELWPELRAIRAARSRPAEITAVYPHRSSVTQDGWLGHFIRAARSRPAEITAVYPHRSSVTQDGWLGHFESAEHAIDILAYSGLFLAENASMLRLLERKAAAGVTIQIALGDPDSPHVAQRGAEEGIGQAMAAKIRNAIVLYRPLCAATGVQIRLHRTVLYNSIYRADDQVLVNQHVYGIPASHSPVYHFYRVESDGMFDCYLNSFNRVWSTSDPLDR